MDQKKDTTTTDSSSVSGYDASSDTTKTDEPAEVYTDSANEITPNDTTDDINLEVDREMILSILQENYSALADVEYDEAMNSFNITPTRDDLILTISLVLAGNADEADWTTITDSFDDLSASLSEESEEPYIIKSDKSCEYRQNTV